MYHQTGWPGATIVESERWGGSFAPAVQADRDVKVTLDYYRYRN